MSGEFGICKTYQNMAFDDMATLLEDYGTEFTITGFQYFKPLLITSIKVDISQTLIQKGSTNKADYVAITQGTGTYYYFITARKWRSESTIEFELEMDTLNTYSFVNADYTLSTRTLITRQHKDRLESGTLYSRYIVDNTTLYMTNGYPLAFLNTADMVETQLDIQAISQYAECSINIYNKYGVLERTSSLQMTSGNYITIVRGTLDTSIVMLYIDIADPNDLSNDTPLLYLNEEYAKGNIVAIDFKQQSAGDYFTYLSDSVIRKYFEGTIVSSGTTAILQRIIDYVPEGINPSLFKYSDDILYDGSDEYHWYVLYANNNTVPASTSDYVNPVDCFVISDNDISITTKNAISQTIYASSIPRYPNVEEQLSILRTMNDGSNIQITIAGTTYTLSSSTYFRCIIFKKNDTDTTFYKASLIPTATSGLSIVNITTPFSYFSIIHCNYCDLIRNPAGITTKYYLGSGANSDTYSLTNIEDLDFSNEMLIKCIALPYAPMGFLANSDTLTSIPDNFSISTNGDLSGTYLKINNLVSAEFSRTIEFTDESPYRALYLLQDDDGYETPAYGQSRNIERESKLFSSEFYSPKFVYDSFVFDFDLESMDTSSFFDTSNYEIFQVNYLVSKNVVSKFMFQFTQYVLTRSTQNYDNVLVVERNNEKAIYSNAYANYVRNGYNFDIKNKNRQLLSSVVNTGISTLGGAVQGATAGSYGLAQGIGTITSAFSSAFNMVMQTKAMDDQIAQKTISASKTKTSVSGSDDIDILEAYSGNKAKLCVYQVSEIMRTELYNYFYYFGYATHEYGVPSIISRIYFNFVQANVVFEDTNFIPEDILNDIKNKWAQGITFMHLDENDEYDIEQQYENWESSLI